MNENASAILEWLPLGVTIVAVLLVLTLANLLVRRNLRGELSVSRQMVMLSLTLAGLLSVVFALPITETSRGQVLSLLGLVITGVIGLSSTTFVANVMAGLMIRAVNSFRPGDFIHCETHFGRVTERGIFHTEIQTEDRDLTTIPNMFLVNNPVTVVHESGTIISAKLSLGYDVAHSRIESLLIEAATRTGLLDAFVLVGDLNDYSVTYRVGGFWSDVTRLLTIKSELRKQILDVMHENNVEIVSPSFMNQRVLPEGQKIIPSRYLKEPVTEKSKDTDPESVIFDKADTAAEREQLKAELFELKASLEALLGDGVGADDPEVLRLKSRIDNVTGLLELKET